MDDVAHHITMKKRVLTRGGGTRWHNVKPNTAGVKRCRAVVGRTCKTRNGTNILVPGNGGIVVEPPFRP
jgi:hypothetical protein